MENKQKDERYMENQYNLKPKKQTKPKPKPKKNLPVRILPVYGSSY